MKTSVDQDTCIGCGLCEQVAPEVYKMDDDKAYVVSDEVAEGKEEDAKSAAEQCPVTCIIIE